MKIRPKDAGPFKSTDVSFLSVVVLALAGTSGCGDDPYAQFFEAPQLEVISTELRARVTPEYPLNNTILDATVRITVNPDATSDVHHRARFYELALADGRVFLNSVFTAKDGEKCQSGMLGPGEAKTCTFSFLLSSNDRLDKLRFKDTQTGRISEVDFPLETVPFLPIPDSTPIRELPDELLAEHCETLSFPRPREPTSCSYDWITAQAHTSYDAASACQARRMPVGLRLANDSTTCYVFGTDYCTLEDYLSCLAALDQDVCQLAAEGSPCGCGSRALKEDDLQVCP